MTFMIENIMGGLCTMYKTIFETFSFQFKIYDMIIGLEILGELGIISNLNDKVIIWDRGNILMKNRSTLKTQESLMNV